MENIKSYLRIKIPGGSGAYEYVELDVTKYNTKDEQLAYAEGVFNALKLTKDSVQGYSQLLNRIDRLKNIEEFERDRT